MPKEVLKCRCRKGYKCPALLHGEIEVITCENNCGLGCDGISTKRRKTKKTISPIG